MKKNYFFYALFLVCCFNLTGQTLNFTIDTAVDTGTTITETIINGSDTYVLTIDHVQDVEELFDLGGGDLIFFLGSANGPTPFLLSITKNANLANFKLNSIEYDTLAAGTISVTNQDDAIIAAPISYPIGSGLLTISNPANAIDISQIKIIPGNGLDLNNFGFHNINVEIVAACVPPAATAILGLQDCGAGTFMVDVNVTDLGGGSPILFDGTTSTSVLATGVTTLGPYPIGTPINLTLQHGTDGACDIALATITDTCPPPCLPPAGTAVLGLQDCDAGTFNIDYNITDLGSGNLVVFDGVNSFPITSIGLFSQTYPLGTEVDVTLLHGIDASCNVDLGTVVDTCFEILFTIDTAVDNGTNITETIVDGTDTYVLTIDHEIDIETLSDLGGGDFVFYLGTSTNANAPFLLSITKNGIPTNFKLNGIDYDTLGVGSISILNQNDAEISANTFYPVGAGPIEITNPENAEYISAFKIVPSTTNELVNFGFHNINIEIVETCIGANCPPINDEPENAEVLTLGADFNTLGNAVTGTNINATASEIVDTSIPATTCSNYAGGDVWYSVVVPIGGNLTIETQSVTGSPVTNTGMEVYSGNIGNLTSIECNDDDSTDGLFSLISLTGQTQGEIVYIRVWEFENNAFGEFQVSAYAPSTYVPDDNFENYLETHDASANIVPIGDSNSMGNGIANDDYVLTAAISAVTNLNIYGNSISDLTGFQDFAAIVDLDAGLNQLTSLDVSQNTALLLLYADDNQLISLNVQNGNNINFGRLFIIGNSDLTCVEVDTQAIADDWSNGVNIPGSFAIDPQMGFSTNCGEVVVRPFAFLQGALLGVNLRGSPAIMRDDLRVANLLPILSPYGDGATVASTVFNNGGTTGAGLPDENIVDWVFVELRDDIDNTFIIETQPALIQRSGRVVGLDGTSDLVFAQPAKHYNIVVNHRNHSGIMTATRQAFPKNALQYFPSNPLETFGINPQVFLANFGIYAMWAGDVNNDDTILFSGANNDANALKAVILENAPVPLITFPVNGYFNSDIDLNGVSKFSGSDNDSNLIKTIILNPVVNPLGFITTSITSQIPNN
jgi:hypothetical protein